MKTSGPSSPSNERAAPVVLCFRRWKPPCVGRFRADTLDAERINAVPETINEDDLLDADLDDADLTADLINADLTAELINEDRIHEDDLLDADRIPEDVLHAHPTQADHVIADDEST